MQGSLMNLFYFALGDLNSNEHLNKNNNKIISYLRSNYN